ncbi:RluA family pseudouridine synthase [Lapidilactobacillus mulanensis]|uniref:Pseudouridine synthase n=1 Tax=Lapidilactobacillus mulanensis TaxID=2485999 RepID=A0ABW4DNW9_9LACO|nr:RluA family pseudouridine synthase [Lapidilactobacillus mulanensis]
MNFKWQFSAANFPEQDQVTLQSFLKHHGFSKSQIGRLKFSGGQIFVNHRQRYTNYLLHDGDLIRVTLAPEKAASTVTTSHLPIEIIYEDDLFLVVNKPAHLASIPSRSHPNDALANRVKGYLQTQGAESLSIHIATRLDMDTSGLVIFGKSAYAHSLLDEQNKQHRMQKMYLALAQGHFEQASGLIDLPIGRRAEHGMERMITEAGKPSKTRYQVLQTYPEGSLVQLQLLTGRTHQIRVHLAALGHPLFGDELYGGPMTPAAQRQALHCAQLTFYQPIMKKEIQLSAPIPSDFLAIEAEMER